MASLAVVSQRWGDERGKPDGASGASAGATFGLPRSSLWMGQVSSGGKGLPCRPAKTAWVSGSGQQGLWLDCSWLQWLTAVCQPFSE